MKKSGKRSSRRTGKRRKNGKRRKGRKRNSKLLFLKRLNGVALNIPV